MELTEITLYFANLPELLENMRIVHISDTHSKGYHYREKLIHKILKQPADLFISTGDASYETYFANPLARQRQKRIILPTGISWQGIRLRPKIPYAVNIYRRFLENYNCSTPPFFVPGNHDSTELLEKLSDLGVVVLKNQAKVIDIPNRTKLNIVGLHTITRTMADIPKAMLEIDPQYFTIALTHFPEFAEPLAAANVELILAGHTHGGQICLPNKKPVVTHNPTGATYAKGITKLKNSTLFTNRGIGFGASVPLRLFCPPEIAIITLCKGCKNHSIKKTKLTLTINRSPGKPEPVYKQIERHFVSLHSFFEKSWKKTKKKLSRYFSICYIMGYDKQEKEEMKNRWSKGTSKT